MSYTASITILTAISIERYFAIIHPMRSKRLATMCLLRVVVVIVWLIAASYSVPYLVVYGTVTVSSKDGGQETYCIQVHEFNMKAYMSINFFLCYVIPLALMVVMYSKISVVLWKTSNKEYVRNKVKVQFKKSSLKQPGNGKKSSQSKNNVPSYGYNQLAQNTDINSSDAGTDEEQASRIKITSNSNAPSGIPRRVSFKQAKRRSILESLQSVDSEEDFELSDFSDFEEEVCMNMSEHSGGSPTNFKTRKQGRIPQIVVNQMHDSSAMEMGQMESRSNRRSNNTHFKKTASLSSHSHQVQMHTALLSRRKVIRLLMAVILSFAMFVLPYHLRILWQTFGQPTFTFTELLITPITFLIYYLNSALNPFLYAFLSDHFRRSLGEAVMCKIKEGRRQRSLHSNTSLRTANTPV